MVKAVTEAPRISRAQYENIGKHVALYKNKIIADGNNSAETL